MNLLQKIKENAKLHNKKIVLPEGTEERTLQAADILLNEKIAQIILIGNPETIKSEASRLNLENISKAIIIDPENHDKMEAYAEILVELRKKKGMTMEQAMGLVGGKQDQYAAAFGGFNLIEFQENGLTNVKPLICKQETINKLEENTLMFYTGINRSASKILLNQTKNVERSQAKQNSLIKMVDLAYSLYKDLSDDNLSSFGEILNINWELKKSLNKDISNDFIDECYKAAINEGALGGKILGAGAGGFLMIYAPKEKHDQIKNKLNNMRNIPVKFYKSGSKIIYNNG